MTEGNDNDEYAKPVRGPFFYVGITVIGVCGLAWWNQPELSASWGLGIFIGCLFLLLDYIGRKPWYHDANN